MLPSLEMQSWIWATYGILVLSSLNFLFPCIFWNQNETWALSLEHRKTSALLILPYTLPTMTHRSLPLLQSAAEVNSFSCLMRWAAQRSVMTRGIKGLRPAEMSPSINRFSILLQLLSSQEPWFFVCMNSLSLLMWSARYLSSISALL